MAQRIKSDLDKVGIDAELTGAPIATSLANYRAGTEELGLWYWGPDYPDPNDYQAFLPGQLVGLRAGWVAGDDPTIEALAKKAAQTVNPAAPRRPLPPDRQPPEQGRPVLPAAAAGPGRGRLQEPHQRDVQPAVLDGHCRRRHPLNRKPLSPDAPAGRLGGPAGAVGPSCASWSGASRRWSCCASASRSSRSS